MTQKQKDNTDQTEQDKHESTFLLNFGIKIERELKGKEDPDLLNKIEDKATEAANYIDENIDVFACTAPAVGMDIILLIKPAQGEYWHSINRKVENIRENVNGINGISVHQPVPVCSTMDKVKDESTIRK